MAAPIQPPPDLYGSVPVFITVKPVPVFPDRRAEAVQAEAYLAEQARIAQATSDCQAQGGSYDGTTCIMPPPPPPPVIYAYTVDYGYASSGLVGSVGYSLPGGNCVNEPGVNNPGYGNPSDWPATSFRPWIGATVLFTFNHTAVVSGIYSDGSIEVRQQNAPGMSHHIYASSIRGYR